MCAVLGVSRSGYYAWRQRPPSDRARENGRLMAEIRVIHRESRGTYGSPRMHRELLARGWSCGRHRVARLMRQHGIVGRARGRRRRGTTRAVAGRSFAPDHIQRDFRAEAPNHKWVSDITQIATQEGWLFLATVIDLYSRRVIGWSMAPHMRETLVIRAVEMAVRQRGDVQAVIHHSDRGGQYTSTAFRCLLRSQHIVPSMGRTGDCYDNAVAESFFATLKCECVQGQVYSTRQAARTAIFDYIETFYNRWRRHSTLGYMCPVAFEAHYQQHTAPCTPS
jgi:putative transposase